MADTGTLYVPVDRPAARENSRRTNDAHTGAAAKRAVESWPHAQRRIAELYDCSSRVSRLQRLIEIVVAVTVLIFAAPMLAVAWLWIRLESPGNPVFRQDRVARGGKLFRFTKFRTLYADARERFPELYAYRYEPEQLEGLVFKSKDDPRVTRAGSWLRPSTMDELPNFWNVLTGDMALVGPRPEIPEMLPYYTDEELMKFTVRPGITGLAQCSGRGDLTFREGLRLDVEYVRNRSLWLDLEIIYRTVVAVLQRRGAF